MFVDKNKKIPVVESLAVVNLKDTLLLVLSSPSIITAQTLTHPSPSFTL